KAGALLAGLIFLGLEIMCFLYWNQIYGWWVMLPPVLVFIWPAARALRWRFTKATISGDRLRYETGFMSKSTRTIQLTKVQDVKVDQRMMQRIFNIGDISIETAGE